MLNSNAGIAQEMASSGHKSETKRSLNPCSSKRF